MTLGEACFKTGWQVNAYVSMPNHFHLVVETPQPNLFARMKWFLGTYTSRFNRRHKLFGHLFSGRYKSLIVDGSGSGLAQERLRLRPLASGATGVWARRRFRRSCWHRWANASGRNIMGQNGRRRGEALAEKIIAEELKRRQWKEDDLKTRPKGDAVKVTLTVAWIAERLGMGTRGHLNYLLYRQRKAGR